MDPMAPEQIAPGLRERAVRTAFEHAHEHPSQWATIRSVAEKLGCTTEALRRRARQAERDGVSVPAWRRGARSSDHSSVKRSN
jgi:transposase-like protein